MRGNQEQHYISDIATGDINTRSLNWASAIASPTFKAKSHEVANDAKLPSPAVCDE